MAVVKNPVLRGTLIALGWLNVGLAFLGVIVPLLPATGPVLIAAYLFSRSSESFDHWLVTNKLFGSIVRDHRAGLGFTINAKLTAVVAIILSFGVTTTWFITAPYARASMLLLATAISTYIVRKPTKVPCTK